MDSETTYRTECCNLFYTFFITNNLIARGSLLSEPVDPAGWSGQSQRLGVLLSEIVPRTYVFRSGWTETEPLVDEPLDEGAAFSVEAGRSTRVVAATDVEKCLEAARRERELGGAGLFAVVGDAGELARNRD